MSNKIFAAIALIVLAAIVFASNFSSQPAAVTATTSVKMATPVVAPIPIISAPPATDPSKQDEKREEVVEAVLKNDVAKKSYVVPQCSTLEDSPTASDDACVVLKPNAKYGIDFQFAKMFKVTNSFPDGEPKSEDTFKLNVSNYATTNIPYNAPALKEASVECRYGNDPATTNIYKVTFGLPKDPILSHYAIAGYNDVTVIEGSPEERNGGLALADTPWRSDHKNSDGGSMSVFCHTLSVTVASKKELENINVVLNPIKENERQQEAEAYAARVRQAASRPDPFPSLVAAYRNFNERCMTLYGSGTADMITALDKYRKYYPSDRQIDGVIEAQLSSIRSGGCIK